MSDQEIGTVFDLPAFQVAALNNGLAKTPPMGSNSWNIFYSNINETQIKQIADAMVSSGTTGLYLDGMGSTGSGANLCLWSNSGSVNQQWQIE